MLVYEKFQSINLKIRVVLVKALYNKFYCSNYCLFLKRNDSDSTWMSQRMAFIKTIENIQAKIKSSLIFGNQPGDY